MAVDLDRMNDERAAKDAKKARGKNVAGTLTVPEGDTWLLLCWPHELMHGSPWVKRMYHRRDLPQGTKADWTIVCQRADWDEEAYSCPGCKQYSKYKKKAYDLWEELGKPKDDKGNRKTNKWDKEARIFEPQAKKIAQVLNITPLFSKDEPEFAKQMKACFLRYGEEAVAKDCEECYLAGPCEAGVVKWYFGSTVHTEMLQHFRDYKDITDPAKMIAVRLTRTGTGLKTRYKTAVFAKNALKLPSKMVARIEKQIQDLTQLDIPPKAPDKAAMVDIYRTFFTLSDVDDDGGDIIPDDDMMGDAAPRRVAADDMGTDDDNLDDVREQLKADSESGKLNRSDDGVAVVPEDDDDIPY